MCITELDVGGAEKAFVRIAVGLKGRGWNVRVVSLRDVGALGQHLASADIPVTALGGGGMGDVRTVFRLRKLLRAQPPQILLCFLYQANIFGRLAAWYAGGPAVISGVRVADRRPWVVWSDRCTRCCTAHYIAVSRQVADTHATLCRISGDRMSAIPNGVDLPTANELSAAESRSARRLLFVGRLNPQKDPLLLLEAFQKLPEDLRQTTTLDYVGQGPLQAALLERIHKFGLEGQVRLLGHRSDVLSLMRASTVLVLPSRWEGLPNVVLEAMANELPVVATRIDGTQELLAAETTGWLVPPRNSNALTAALTEALRSPHLRHKFARTAQHVVAERFTWNETVIRYDRLLRTFLPATRSI